MILHVESTNMKSAQQNVLYNYHPFSLLMHHSSVHYKPHSVSQYRNKVKCTKDITSLITHSDCGIKALFILQSQSHAGISNSNVY